MKHTKKIVALVLALVSLMAVAAPALASATGYITYLGGDGTSNNIRSGQSGQAVMNLQLMLCTLGYDTVGIDGKFGPNTEKAVKKFQSSNSLSADGIVGAKTKKAIWAALGEEAPWGCNKLK